MNKCEMLDAIKRHLNMSKNTDFASYLGISSQSLSNWYSRNTFDAELIYTKCVFVNAAWLLTGKGEMLSKNVSELYSNVVSESKSIYKKSNSNQDNVYLQLYKDKDEEVKLLNQEIGKLKEQISVLKLKIKDKDVGEVVGCADAV